ncbi:MAG: alginate export family protein [Candidatus Omnitrophota bacterium]|nr:alginate export family protein [Candidatus Omnitrophota bacterium]
MKLLKVLCVIALVFAVSAVAYAETQSVKISGDIAMRGFARGNYDLNNDPVAIETGVVGADTGAISTAWATFLQSTAEVQIDADLTDNVGGVIRLVNQRVWGNSNYFSEAGSMTGSIEAPFGDRFTSIAIAPGGDAFEVGVDLAYIELKEFLYSPLTLKIGRQDLWFGKGFIVGASQSDPSRSLFAREYTAINSFDAVRATLDYNPWTVDGVYAKIAENGLRADDDTNLWGINIGYVFDQYNAEVEGYSWYKNRRFCGNSASANAATLITTAYGHDTDDVINFGARGSFDPVEDWTVAVEGAYQCGEFLGFNGQKFNRNRRGFAVDAMVECRYFQEDYAWHPVGSLEYILYSGQHDIGDVGPTTNGAYKGWDRMYRGKFDTAIREFQNVYYKTLQGSTPSCTNQHQLLMKGTVEPTDSLTVDATYGLFWLAERYSSSITNKDVGSELDLNVTWDYTEDVSFNFLAGWFFPGEHFLAGRNDVATDVVGTVKLSF